MAVDTETTKSHICGKMRTMKKWGLILIILVIAAVFRFQHITTIPPGLYPDEAMNGNDALQANVTGNYKVFYPENNGREGLFINIQAMSLKIFGNQPWALRIVSAIIGILTVWGVYFLAKQMFNWQIGAIASFLLATSFWHTMFSRIGFRAIMAPFFVVWALYFFWRGLAGGRLWNFAISGILWGLGFYTYISFRIMPLVLIFALLAYWRTIKKDFAHEKYEYARNTIVRGFALLMVTAIIAALPLGWYFYTHPADFLGRTGQISVFASDNFVKAIAVNTIRSFGIFNFIGDYNWRQNFSGEPLLFWPVGVLFAFGFLRSWWKLIRSYRKHGHFSTVQVTLLSWFLVGLLPVILSNEGLPHALRSIIVAPVVFIFAAEGLWWIYEKINTYYQARDFHPVRNISNLFSITIPETSNGVNIHRKKYTESSLAAGLIVILFLIASMIFEYHKYFYEWALNPNVPPAFAQNYVNLGKQLNLMSREIKKYILVNASGVLVNGIPMPAQTVMFITDTWTLEKQKAKNIFYLTEEQFKLGRYTKNSIVLFLNNQADY